MGLLTVGTPLDWSDAKKEADRIRKLGVEQFIKIYNKVKNREKDSLLWGDEIEYMVLELDHEGKGAKVCLRAQDILAQLKSSTDSSSTNVLWSPEYARYMLESCPAKPFGSEMIDLLKMEENMKLRRKLVEQLLAPNEKLFTLTSFPLLGTDGFVGGLGDNQFTWDAGRSMFIPDECINSHARFKTLTKNIRQRRGRKVSINVPIFPDKNTPNPYRENLVNRINYDPEYEAKDDHVILDCMCFGMGCCCLQVTFQAFNLNEARTLYDQLSVISPIVMAITAASPIHRGHLTNVDARWNIISGSVDDRTREESGEKSNAGTPFRRIYKSRYDSIDSYLSSPAISSHFKPEYNDIPLVMDEGIYGRLLEAGVDDPIARHVAHLFIRDPLVIYAESLKKDSIGEDENSVEHFENIQSTNWQTMRFKPPPLNNPNIGWRIEFRSMEVQLTDFENAAFAIFVVLLSRAILKFNLNFYIPISLSDENLQRAQKIDAIKQETFWFRRHIIGSGQPDEYLQLKAHEIMNGNSQFDGLLCHIYRYLRETFKERETLKQFEPYLNLIKQRCNGKLKTMAAWQRDFVRNHPDYKHDSQVSSKTVYDMLCRLEKMTKINSNSGEEDDGHLFQIRKLTKSNSTKAGLGTNEHPVEEEEEDFCNC